MKAVRIYETGTPDVLKIENLELADPAAGEVRIRHTAIGLNFQDIYTRSGQYAAPLPTGLGTEAVGVVEGVGEGGSPALGPGEKAAHLTGERAPDRIGERLRVALLAELPLGPELSNVHEHLEAWQNLQCCRR